MSKRELTGKRRYRECEGLIVLQVEEQWLTPQFLSGIVEHKWVKQWRDAILEDLTQHDIDGAKYER